MKPFRLMLAAAFAVVATHASAYLREYDGTTPIAWVKDRTVALQLSLTPPTRVLSDGSTSFNAVAVSSLQAWNPHLAHLRLSYVLNSPVKPAEGDDEMSVEFSTTIFGKTFGAGTLAITLLTYRSGNMEETDTLFNTANYVWDSYRGPLRAGAQDLRRVAIHEFGHTLGLDHPDQAKPPQHVSAIMNSTVSNIENPTPDDIAGVTAIYGTGPAYQTIPSGPVLMDLSTRGVTSTGDNVLIGGFIVQGTQPARFIVRSLAYSLTSFGVPNALGDSVIELHDAHNNLIASNDDWFTAANAPYIASFGRDPPNSIESALYVTLNPGNYTAVVRSYSDASQPAQTGVALFEVYDLRTSAAARLGNVSTRGQVGTGNNILIAGFIVGGTGGKTILIRALGPTLAASNVPGVLVDPSLELRNANGNLIESNDDWQQSAEAGIIAGENYAPPDPKESAIQRTLGPGNYTALVRGVGNTTGNALVEVYDKSPGP